MAKVNRIISLIDFSEYSEPLVRWSAGLSKALNAKVVFLHHLEVAIPSMANTEQRSQYASQEKEEAWGKLKELTMKESFIEKDVKITEKAILPALNELRNERYHDIVLTGLKGAGVFKQLFIGSTTLKIVNESDLLTMAVPPKLKPFVPEQLVVAVHPRFPVNQKRFNEFLAGFSDQIKGIEFCSIVTKNDDEQKINDYLSKLKESYQEYSPAIQTFKGDDAFTEIKDYMTPKTDAFLVLQQGSRSLKDRLFRRLMINDLVYYASTPLIVIPE